MILMIRFHRTIFVVFFLYLVLTKDETKDVTWCSRFQFKPAEYAFCKVYGTQTLLYYIGYVGTQSCMRSSVVCTVGQVSRSCTELAPLSYQYWQLVANLLKA